MSMVKTPNANIYYELSGQGSPVLFIQGIGVTGEGWRPQLEELSRDFQTVTFDNRGIGRSQIISGGVSVSEMAADAFALMDSLGWESAHIVGHSLGGIIAQEMALNHPKRVISLTLMCTFARGKDGGRFSFWSLWMFLRTRVGPSRSRRHAFLEMLFPKSYFAMADLDELAERVGKIVGRDLATTPAVLMKQFGALSAHDRYDDLAGLKGIPTLVISGGLDPIAKPAFGQDLAGAIPNAKYFEFANSSHALPIQMPREVNAELKNWLKSNQPRESKL